MRRGAHKLNDPMFMIDAIFGKRISNHIAFPVDVLQGYNMNCIHEVTAASKKGSQGVKVVSLCKINLTKIAESDSIKR